MKTMILIFTTILAVLGCSEPETEPLAPNTYVISILDEQGREVLRGKGELGYCGWNYYGGTGLSLEKPESEIAIPDEENFMVMFMNTDRKGKLESSVMSQHYYSLESDFGFIATSGGIHTLGDPDKWMTGTFSMTMEARPGEYARNAHPKWGRRITVTGKFAGSSAYK